MIGGADVNSRPTFKKHHERHVADHDLKCRECGEEFTNRVPHQLHVTNAHKTGSHECLVMESEQDDCCLIDAAILAKWAEQSKGNLQTQGLVAQMSAPCSFKRADVTKEACQRSPGNSRRMA